MSTPSERLIEVLKKGKTTPATEVKYEKPKGFFEKLFSSSGSGSGSGTGANAEVSKPVVTDSSLNLFNIADGDKKDGFLSRLTSSMAETSKKGLETISTSTGVSKDFFKNLVLFLAAIILIIALYFFIRYISKKIQNRLSKTDDNEDDDDDEDIETLKYNNKKCFDGKSGITIPAKKLNADEGSLGEEYTIAMWLYVRNLRYNPQVNNHILTKGFYNPKMETKKVSPEIFLRNDEKNDITVATETTYGREIITIKNIPVHRWFHLALTASGSMLTIYIDGKVTHSTSLNGTIIPNNMDILLGQNGGFDGRVCFLEYKDYSESFNEIYRRYKKEIGSKKLKPLEKIDYVTGNNNGEGKTNTC